ncbi:hypothetical protein V8C37DRAFT_291780 [Trichoderma ceciliae]
MYLVPTTYLSGLVLPGEPTNPSPPPRSTAAARNSPLSGTDVTAATALGTPRQQPFSSVSAQAQQLSALLSRSQQVSAGLSSASGSGHALTNPEPIYQVPKIPSGHSPSSLQSSLAASSSLHHPRFGLQRLRSCCTNQSTRSFPPSGLIASHRIASPPPLFPTRSTRADPRSRSVRGRETGERHCNDTIEPSNHRTIAAQLHLGCNFARNS